MNKTFTTLALLGLCGMAIVSMSACAKQAGPLGAHANVLGPGNTMNSDLPTGVDGSGPNSISGTAKIIFSMDMDPSTINTSTIKVFTQDDVNTAETPYTNYRVTYNTLLREATLWPTNGTAWADGKNYHAVITTGCLANNGKPFDNNGNNIAEGDTFDAGHGFWTMDVNVAPTSLGYNTDNYIRLASVAWYTDAGNGTFITNGAITTPEAGAYDMPSYLTIVAHLALHSSISDPNFEFASDNYTKISIVNAAGQAVGWTGTPAVSTTTLTNDTIQWVFPFPPSTTLKFKILGGLNGMRNGNVANTRLLRNFFLDGNHQYGAEASDNTHTLTLTSGPAAGPLLGPSVVDQSSGDSEIDVLFDVPTGNGTLKGSTINNSNFVLHVISITPYGTSTVIGIDKLIVPKSLELDNSGAPNPNVRVFIPSVLFEGYDQGTVSVELIVMQNVESNDGKKMDQDGDNILGEAGDDTFTTDPYDFTNHYNASSTGGPAL